MLGSHFFEMTEFWGKTGEEQMQLIPGQHFKKYIVFSHHFPVTGECSTCQKSVPGANLK